jgi:hypothetical protein
VISQTDFKEAFSETEMPFMILCVSKLQKFNSKTHGTHEAIQLRKRQRAHSFAFWQTGLIHKKIKRSFIPMCSKKSFDN